MKEEPPHSVGARTPDSELYLIAYLDADGQNDF